MMVYIPKSRFLEYRASAQAAKNRIDIGCPTSFELVTPGLEGRSINPRRSTIGAQFWNVNQRHGRANCAAVVDVDSKNHAETF
ncbi:MAG: hypothetical protein ACRCV9_17895 [Burkholderiaceae bacterium]